MLLIISNFVKQKQITNNPQAMNKNIHIVSELQGILLEDNGNRAIKSILSVMKSLRIQDRTIGAVKNVNCKFTNRQILDLVVLFPMYLVKSIYDFTESSLSNVFGCGRDMFYRFMRNGNIDWRKIVYSISRQLLHRIDKGTEAMDRILCLVIDDTDMTKSGRCFEFLGRIFSHVAHRSVFGMKALFLMLTDGKSQTLLDVSLHGEEGNNPSKPQGLTKKQREQRYSKKRSADEKVNNRIDELFESKIKSAIRMIRRAMLVEGIRFRYLLVDSWLPCAELLKFIHSRHNGCDLLGMIKMGNTKYSTEYGELNANKIIERLQKSGAVKFRRTIMYYTAACNAEFAGVKVKLFFYRKGKNGAWNALITTDMGMNDVQAFHQYSWRWSIEVVNHEMKSMLRLGKCECRDFASQIAAISICMIQYNIMSYVKRFDSYETMGGLFAEVTKSTVELSLVERIWLLILETISAIAEFTGADTMSLLETLFRNSDKIKNLKRAVDKLCGDDDSLYDGVSLPASA